MPENRDPASIDILSRLVDGSFTIGVRGVQGIEDEDVRTEILSLDQVIYALWVYWDLTKNPKAKDDVSYYSERQVKLFFDQLSKEKKTVQQAFKEK